MSSKRTSLEKFRLRKALEILSNKEGRGTELISLYLPFGRQISEVVNRLKQEYGTASNIKSTTTRKNVQDSIVKVTQRLRLFKNVPEKGLVIFCGAIPQDGPGSERMEIYVINPPEPINIYLYRCDARFHTEHLQEFLQETETFGIIVIDLHETTFAKLKGKSLDIVEGITSGIPGKHRAGGQSARRFQRQREAARSAYFTRIGRHANEIFVPIPDLKGLIIGGPGPTKDDFNKGDYLHYTLKDKVISIIDTAYVREQGVEEIVERSPKLIQRIRYVEEKRIMQGFLYEIGHDSGLASYGEEDVKKNLKKGAVKNLLLSESLDKLNLTLGCKVCDYVEQESISGKMFNSFEQSIVNKSCPNCNSTSLSIEKKWDVIDELADLAESSGADVEVISVETEEGQMLKSFGGIAAILRFKT